MGAEPGRERIKSRDGEARCDVERELMNFTHDGADRCINLGSRVRASIEPKPHFCPSVRPLVAYTLKNVANKGAMKRCPGIHPASQLGAKVLDLPTAQDENEGR